MAVSTLTPLLYIRNTYDVMSIVCDLQRAALQLLASLKKLRSLQLGGAELLLPSAPYHPVAAPAGASTPAALDNMLNINVLGQHNGGLIAAAVAAVSRADVPRGNAAAASQSALQGEYMRKVLGGRAEELDTFKLQFNCCGTGVEKVSSYTHLVWQQRQIVLLLLFSNHKLKMVYCNIIG